MLNFALTRNSVRGAEVAGTSLEKVAANVTQIIELAAQLAANAEEMQEQSKNFQEVVSFFCLKRNDETESRS